MSGEREPADEEKLEKLYERFGKFFNLLDSSSDGERAAAVHKAWKAMQEINEIESRLYPVDQRSNLKFAAIFEKAAQSGSVPADMPELADALTANAALKESEGVAIARLDRLEYLYREMKKKAYIDLMRDGTVSRANVKAMEKYTADMVRTAETLAETFEPVREALEKFTAHADASDDAEKPAPEADPLLLLLHNALRKDLDFVRILEEGGNHSLTWKEKLARKLSNTPMDERDLALWRRLHAAQTNVIRQQQSVLGGMEAVPHIVKDLRESMAMIEAERDVDAVPRATHEKALEHLDTALSELSESKARQETLETENKALTDVHEELEQARAIVQEQEEEIENLQERRARFIKHERAYGRAVRARLRRAQEDIVRANDMIAALQTGDMDNILESLKKHGALDKSERTEMENKIAALERGVKQKNAELKILQDRIDIWVGEHDQQEQEIAKWQRRAARNYGIGIAFALAAGAFAASGTLPYILSDSMATTPLRTAVIAASIIGGVGGMVFGWLRAEPGRYLRGALVGAFTGAAAMITGAAIPTIILGDWVEKMQASTPVKSINENDVIVKPAPAVRQQDGRWIIEIPMPAPVPTPQ
jgi:hypothetical protein